MAAKILSNIKQTSQGEIYKKRFKIFKRQTVIGMSEGGYFATATDKYFR